ncbi:AAA family ATPase [Mycobacterium sp. pV006]|uniref:AAA family ATPase n=1 Tax=Mycobacterium sp. pV006 TaxID=3238983 RepID=UPI00351BCCC4
MARPRIADRVIGRPDILARLTAATERLITVTAPAGYGKTTVAAQWADADPRPSAWIRIDHLDNDPVHLLLHIATAVAGPDGAHQEPVNYLRAPGRDLFIHLLPAVIQILEQRSDVVLVLDDVHKLTSTDAVAVLGALLDATPVSATTALLSRCRLPLNVAHRRMQEDVLAIDAETLRFTDEETAEVVESIHGACDPTTLATVVDLCEGWAAGVVLTAMALRDGASVDTLTGRHDVIVDYMVQEVIDRLDCDVATFLTESAVLETFTAEQLDAVLGRADSARMLELLVRSGNLFLVSLDREHRSYRYHHLFADVLRNRLRDMSPDRYRELASRAADLLEASGDIDGALIYAVAAGDRARSAALVGREAVRLGFDGRAGVLARRLAMLDARTFVEWPDAAVAQAWLGVVEADAELIQRSLMAALRADRGRPLADGTPSVKIAVALVSSLVGGGGVREVVRQADVVCAAGGALMNPWWGAATVMKGAAESMLGRVDRARVLLESALASIEDLPGFHAAALAHLALLDLGAGEDEWAVQRSDAARALVDKFELRDVVPMVVVYATNAAISARLGDEAAARESVAVTEKLLGRLDHLAARTALLSHGLLAWTGTVLGDLDLARRHLDAAERARRREPDAVALVQRVERVKAMLAGGVRPLTSAELRLLPYLATNMSLQGIADELVVGRETTKSQAASIYRKLGVSSRGDAVIEARRIGLINDTV